MNYIGCWNDEADSLLRELWLTTMSTREIGKKVGRSKNAVIGRARRLDLPVRKSAAPRSAKNVVRAPSGRFKLPRFQKIPLPPPAPIVAPSGAGVPLLEVKEYQCRAIIGSSMDARGLAVFCGEAVKPKPGRGHYSFCPYHCSLYYQPLGVGHGRTGTSTAALS